MALPEGSELRTDESAQAVIRFPDDSIVRLEPKTHFQIESLGARETRLSLHSGRLHAWVRGLFTSRFSVRTPNAVAAIRGTELSIGVEGGKSDFSLSEGRMEIRDNRGESLVLGAEERVEAGAGGLGTPELLSLDSPEVKPAFHPAAFQREIARDASVDGIQTRSARSSRPTSSSCGSSGRATTSSKERFEFDAKDGFGNIDSDPANWTFAAYFDGATGGQLGLDFAVAAAYPDLQLPATQAETPQPAGFEMPSGDDAAHFRFTRRYNNGTLFTNEFAIFNNAGEPLRFAHKLDGGGPGGDSSKDLSPGAFPGYSLLSAFGQAAPLNLGYQRENRVLPFPFHFLDNHSAMNVRPKNYSWPEFYERQIDLTRHSFSGRRILARFRANLLRNDEDTTHQQDHDDLASTGLI